MLYIYRCCTKRQWACHAMDDGTCLCVSLRPTLKLHCHAEIVQSCINVCYYYYYYYYYYEKLYSALSHSP